MPMPIDLPTYAAQCVAMLRAPLANRGVGIPQAVVWSLTADRTPGITGTSAGCARMNCRASAFSSLSEDAAQWLNVAPAVIAPGAFGLRRPYGCLFPSDDVAHSDLAAIELDTDGVAVNHVDHGAYE